MLCISGPKFVILAWMSDELSCGQARDWHTHTHRRNRWQYPKASGKNLHVPCCPDQWYELNATFPTQTIPEFSVLSGPNEKRVGKTKPHNSKANEELRIQFGSPGMQCCALKTYNKGCKLASQRLWKIISWPTPVKRTSKGVGVYPL